MNRRAAISTGIWLGLAAACAFGAGFGLASTPRAVGQGHVQGQVQGQASALDLDAHAAMPCALDLKRGASMNAPGAVDDALGRDVAPTGQLDPGRLTGLWRQIDGGPAGDRLRFWYFHGDGKGLYRYGKTSLNNTHSFDYEPHDDGLRVTFRKTGNTHDLKVEISAGDDGAPVLSLTPDPEEPGASYRLERGPVVPEARAATGGGSVGGRLWMDARRFATGGMGFAMYQLNDSAIDGRGVGWFHEGDFDDWSTEALTYRLSEGVLTLEFTQRAETVRVPVRVEGAGEARTLVIEDDPRDFWKDHRYRDVGESFGSLGLVSPHWLSSVVRRSGQ